MGGLRCAGASSRNIFCFCLGLNQIRYLIFSSPSISLRIPCLFASHSSVLGKRRNGTGQSMVTALSAPLLLLNDAWMSVCYPCFVSQTKFLGGWGGCWPPDRHGFIWGVGAILPWAGSLRFIDKDELVLSCRCSYNACIQGHSTGKRRSETDPTPWRKKEAK